jgi:hypothetical protein
VHVKIMPTPPLEVARHLKRSKSNKDHMIKINDILPLNCPASYYFGKGSLAYLDNDQSITIVQVAQGTFTVPLLSLTDKELDVSKKKLSEALQDAIEEWHIDSGKKFGMFRFQED